MKSVSTLPAQALRIAVLFVSLAFLAPGFAIADCSEEEQTAVFILDGIHLNSLVTDQPEALAGKNPAKAGKSELQMPAGADLLENTESFWSVANFNCANLDPDTPDNHAWWCGDEFVPCHPSDPAEGYGNAWSQWLGWQGAVPDPEEPISVTVRARMNMDTEPGYDKIHLQCVSPQGVHNLWSDDGFAEGMMVEQTFTLQPEDYTDPFDTVHLRWTFMSDGGWSDEDCTWPTAGAVQIDLIEVYFDQGDGPVQMGHTETCEPGSDLQWTPEVEELRLTLLDVEPLGPVTNPSIAEMIEAVEAVQPVPGPDYNHRGQVGSFHLFEADPIDLGGTAIVDGRDGRVVFAGTVIWLGFGAVTSPVESSHPWSFPTGEPALEPASLGILPNLAWPDHYETPADITARALDYLRGSDVLQSFSNCGEYDVVSYIYTPSVNPYVPPETTSLIVIVSGQCGPPWADFVAATPPVASDPWLSRVYPNPFNPQTRISFTTDTPQQVRVAVFDPRGRRIAVLADQQFQAGKHFVEWQGRDASGRAVPSGEYFFRVDIGGRVETRKAMLLR